nr:uncharacterized protein LOC112424934 [Macaca nemestrina]
MRPVLFGPLWYMRCKRWHRCCRSWGCDTVRAGLGPSAGFFPSSWIPPLCTERELLGVGLESSHTNLAYLSSESTSFPDKIRSSEAGATALVRQLSDARTDVFGILLFPSWSQDGCCSSSCHCKEGNDRGVAGGARLLGVVTLNSQMECSSPPMLRTVSSLQSCDPAAPLPGSAPEGVSSFFYFLPSLPPFKTGFHSVTPAGVQRLSLSKLHTQLPGLEQSSHLRLRSSWPCATAPANDFVFAEMRCFHVAQAGLELLSSRDPPGSASQNSGATGVSHRTWPAVSFPSAFLSCDRVPDTRGLKPVFRGLSGTRVLLSGGSQDLWIHEVLPCGPRPGILGYLRKPCHWAVAWPDVGRPSHFAQHHKKPC